MRSLTSLSFLLHRLSRWLFVFLITGAGAFGASAGPGPATGPVAGSGLPALGTVLNADGTLRAGASGSFNPEGFAMSTAPDGKPSFRPARAAGAADTKWQSGFALPGVRSLVYAMLVVGTDVYVGGVFDIAGGVAAKGIAKWDGSTWTTLGTGFNNGVNALALVGADLYAGGTFTTAGGVAANYIAKWNGSAWSALGSGLNNQVNALATDGTNLYVGGSYTTAGPSAANYVAKWDGSTWSALGSGVSNPVNALALVGTDLYVAGYFTTAGGAAANSIAKWNGATWSALGSGINGTIYALAVMGTDLYVGGSYSTAGGVAAANLAKWSGTAWSTVGGGTDNVVSALLVAGTTLYAGGTFTAAGGTAFNRVAKWSGGTWSGLGTGVNAQVQALAVMGTDVFVGGFVSAAGGASTKGLARWDGAAWNTLGVGLNFGVRAIAVSGSNVYVAGDFTTTGNAVANRIAKWDGSSWSALGTGMNNVVYALAVSGTTVYAGGSFTTAGGVAALRVAQWNGSSWSPLGSGMGNTVYALAMSGTDLYAAGSFTTAGGSPALRVAKWNGAAWSALGGGLNDYVYALAVSGSTVYAGGQFTLSGSTGMNSVAKWNGAAWSALGVGANGTVYSLAVVGTDLYAGGYYTAIGGVTTDNLGKWNGSTWSAVSGGTNADVKTMATDGANLYIGGRFTTAGGVFVRQIAKWSGTVWSTLGTGLNDQVDAVAVGPGNKLYAGGIFTAVGDNSKLSVFFGVYNTDPTPTIASFTPTSGTAGSTSVTITGTDFTGATSVRFNGTAATTFSVVSFTSITATVPAGATSGTLSVTGPAGTGTSAASFTVIPPPTITSLAPGSGPVGSVVVIGGTNFSNASAVTFNGVNAPGFVVDSPTQITVSVPTGATAGLVRVTTPGGTGASSGNYTVTFAPLVSGFTPGTGPVGQSVAISGSNFTGATAVAFNGTAAPGFVLNSSTSITATVPAGASTGPVSVTTGVGSGSSASSFTVLPTPTLTSFAPAMGPIGRTVVLTGTNLDVVTTVRFNGTLAAAFVLDSPTQITVTVPTGATTGTVSVSAPGGTATSTASFVITPGITSFSPGSGAPGTSVVITGSTFTGASAVAFNGTAAPGFVVNSASQITVNVPIGATTGPISVTIPAGTGTSSSSFSVTGGVPPVVTGVTVSSYPSSPTYYSIGQTVDFQVTFDRAVTVGGGALPILPVILTTGFGSPAATQLFGNNTATLTFRYTVANGDLDLDGLALGSAMQLAGSGSSISNAVDGAAANLTLNNVAATANLIIDGQPPVVTSCVRRVPATTTATGPDVTFRVTFSEPVYGSLAPVSAASFVPVITGGVGGTVSTAVAVAGQNNRVYDVTLTGINGNGSVRLDVPATGPIIQDFAFNHLLTAFTTGEVYTIIPGNLTVTTAQNVGGIYNTVTVGSGGSATLTGPLTVNGSMSVGSGGSFSSRSRSFFWRAAPGSSGASNGTASADPCNVVTGPGTFSVAPGATISICDPAGISTTGSTGFIQVAGTRTYSDQASYLYDGDAPQTTGSGLPATVRELALANPAGLTLSNDVAIRELVRLGSGAITRAGHSLTLLSDASGTALVDNSGGGSIAAGPGLSRMQRYISPSPNPGLGYRHFSSPLLATPLSQLATAGFTLVAPAGFNTSATPRSYSPFPNVMLYDQARLGTSPATDLSAFDKGWYVPTTGINVGEGIDLNIAPPAKLTFGGDFNLNATADVQLARGPQADAGWAFIGNPFPAPFDLNATGATSTANVEAAVYIFESTAQYSGGYRAFVNGVGNGPQVIAAGQGFFVRAGTAAIAPHFQFNAAGRSTTFAAQPTFRRTGPDLRPQVSLALQAGTTVADEVFIYAEAGATPAADAAFDAHKLPNPGQVSVWAIATGGTPLAIQGLPALTGGTIVPLTLFLPVAGATSFAATLRNIPTGLTLVLTDALTGIRQDLAVNPTYRFHAPAGTVGGRFALQVTLAGTALGTATPHGATLALYPNPAHTVVALLLPGVPTVLPLRILDVLGREVHYQLVAANVTNVSLSLTGLPAGVYAVRCGAATARLVVE